MNYDQAHAVWLCKEYANMLSVEKPEFSQVALECAAIIEDDSKLVPTYAENRAGSCQALSNFLIEPEIDYGSGFP